METFGFDWDLKQFEIQNSSGKPPRRGGGGIDGMEKGVLGGDNGWDKSVVR